MRGGQRCSRRVGKQLQKAKRPSLKTGIVTAKRKVQLTLSQVRRRRGDEVDNEDDDDVVRTVCHKIE